jgi:hypothetical protein
MQHLGREDVGWACILPNWEHRSRFIHAIKTKIGVVKWGTPSADCESRKALVQSEL